MISRRKKDEPTAISGAEMDAIEAAAIAGKPLMEKIGAELLDEAVSELNMDRYLDRSPKVGKPIDYEGLVKVLHRKREMFITAEAKRKSGVKDEEPTNEEG